MTITIEIKPETEKILTEAAKQNGLPLAKVIEQYVDEQANINSNKNGQSRVNVDEWQKNLDEWAESVKSEDGFLSDESLRREYIYEDFQW